MRIAKLPANQAWVLLLGDTIVAVNVGVTEQRLFPTRDEIVNALALRGLAVSRAGVVSTGTVTL